MKFVWVSVTGVLLVTLVHATTTLSPADDTKEDNVAEATEQLTLENIEDGVKQSELPILPPLILLDFTNGTNSSSSDEKIKRTVNDNLGYGFQTNNFFEGKKLNYYFPSGKSGTTVSIEESISPFLPRTIIERTKPVTEKAEVDGKNSGKNAGFRSQYANIQPAFGQKTKFQYVNPAIALDFSRYSTTNNPIVSTSTEKTIYATSTPMPPYRGFYTPKPLNHPSSTPKSFVGYTTPSAFISTTLSPPYNKFGSKKISSSTMNPIVSEQFYHPVKTLPPAHTSFSNEKTIHPSSLSSYPKYTFENGIKYEHKIIWKYPDGRVSDDPPSSYVHSYSEYDSVPKTVSYSINSNSASNVKNYDNLGYESNLRFQGPMQFPKDSEPNFPKQTSFVKPMPQNNAQRAKNHQYYPNTQAKYNVPKLEVGTSNAEYLPPAEDNLPKDHIFSSSGQLSSQTLSKQPIESQKLNKVLSPTKDNYDTDDASAYSNSHYANLLNYNPSISQYIKNPASILNAQPTFIQAGNSLIPVIILRVDGAPPVQQKPTTNINLKALLQQYISQYASSVSDMSQDTNYNFEDEELVNRYEDPHYDLKKLTDTLKRISQQTSSPRPKVGDTVTDSYGNILGGEYKSLVESRRNADYRNVYKQSQKVKSVQIIEDPRFPNLKQSN